MKKNSAIAKILSAAMALALLLACTGCGGNGGSGNTSTPAGPDSADEISFPLEEPVSFNFMIPAIEATNFRSDLENNAVWKRWKEETNVDITFTFLGNTSDAATQVALLASSGTYGDVLMGGPILNSITASLYYRSGMIVPITQYVNEQYMPNLMERVIKEDPLVMRSITAQDGEVICLPQYNALEGQYLESPMWINKAWLDKLGLGIPTTLDELTNVLRRFATGDPNGNGKQDEIPLMVATSGNFIAFEPLMGMFGVATKSGTNDAYVQVKDGKVEFQPTSQGYKDALKWFHQIYEEELIYPEAFTAARATAEAKLGNDIPVVGVFTNGYRYETSYKDEYVCILPPKAPGYDTCWYYHPGIDGTKNMCFITDKCKNVGVLTKWLDRIYDFDNSVSVMYNQPGDGRIDLGDDGKYILIENDVTTQNQLNLENPTLVSMTQLYTTALTKADYEERFFLSGYNKDRQDAYEMYSGAGVLNTELWPRPYLVGQDANNISDISTDLFYSVDQFFTKTVTGVWDIDAQWDSYVAELNELGLDEYIEALQNAYDAYLKA